MRFLRKTAASGGKDKVTGPDGAWLKFKPGWSSAYSSAEEHRAAAKISEF
jgi:hypothetical protein